MWTIYSDKQIRLIFAIDAIGWTEDNANDFISYIETVSKYGGDQDYCRTAFDFFS